MELQEMCDAELFNELIKLTDKYWRMVEAARYVGQRIPEMDIIGSGIELIAKEISKRYKSRKF